mmetsp:Transcript_4821/g.18489  ORF Transcript_4821/g.18489 Transcript_4821/m.18489 type:complete len:222 (+) Transcript_4821:242-907(+)
MERRQDFFAVAAEAQRRASTRETRGGAGVGDGASPRGVDEIQIHQVFDRPLQEGDVAHGAERPNHVTFSNHDATEEKSGEPDVHERQHPHERVVEHDGEHLRRGLERPERQRVHQDHLNEMRTVPSDHAVCGDRHREQGENNHDWNLNYEVGKQIRVRRQQPILHFTFDREEFFVVHVRCDDAERRRHAKKPEDEPHASENLLLRSGARLDVNDTEEDARE